MRCGCWGATRSGKSRFRGTQICPGHCQGAIADDEGVRGVGEGSYRVMQEIRKMVARACRNARNIRRRSALESLAWSFRSPPQNAYAGMARSASSLAESCWWSCPAGQRVTVEHVRPGHAYIRQTTQARGGGRVVSCCVALPASACRASFPRVLCRADSGLRALLMIQAGPPQLF